MIHIAVLGYGTVGSGVVEVLNTNNEIIKKKTGEDVRLKYVLDIRDFEGDPIQKYLTKDFDVILNDDEVKVVAEVMGGIEPAYTFVKKALEKGKSVVTSNKELVAKHGAELIEIARSKNTNFFFEASVGGGIPVIRPLIQSLTADDILEISGILNGTTNYILSKMTAEGRTYEDMLKAAQEKGYAERNPAADVEGHDACRKIAILASLATGLQVDYEDIYTEGITEISVEDIEYAKKLNMTIKLLAHAKKTEKGVYAKVSPALVGADNPLSMVNNVFNAVLVKGNMLGDVMFYGKGAGKLATASAVVSDIVDAIKHSNINVRITWDKKKLETLSVDKVVVKRLVRVEFNNKDSAVKQVKELFGVDDIYEIDGLKNEFAFVSNEDTEENIKGTLTKLINDENITNIIGTIIIND